MKITLLIFVFILTGLQSLLHAQKHDYIWQLGYTDSISCLFDFNYGNDSTYSIYRAMSYSRTNTSICDTSGNLLFYTNGIYIADSSDQMMLNGDSLNPGTTAQNWNALGYPLQESTVILPVPKQDSLYHLFHISYHDLGNYLDRFYRTTINMNLNNGKGAVIAKNELILQDSFINELEAMKHANGEDWWVLIPKYFDNKYIRFLVTKDTILGPYYQTIGSASPGNNYGQASFSPSGTKYARYDASSDLDIYDFDRCTGLLSNYQHVVITDTSDIVQGLPVAGLVFSPNSQYVYVNSAGLFVYQFDVTASNITASIDTVAIYDGYYYLTPINQGAFFTGQLAPNGKIYFNSTGSMDILHVIHNPDSAGTACHFEQHGFQLPIYGITMPSFPHYRTPALSTPCDTMTDIPVITESDKEEIKLYPNPAIQQVTLDWEFGTEDLNRNLIVTNALGQVVYRQDVINRSNRINIGAWPAGLYLCKMYENEAAVHTEKLVIIKP